MPAPVKPKRRTKKDTKDLMAQFLFLLFNIEGELLFNIEGGILLSTIQFFQNINFNNDFYAIPNYNQGISLAYANTHYSFLTGVATSTTTTTTLFSGSVGIGTIGGNAGTLNALNINAIHSLQINGNDTSNIYVSSNVIPNYLLP
jgi:hypothetical protein